MSKLSSVIGTRAAAQFDAVAYQTMGPIRLYERIIEHVGEFSPYREFVRNYTEMIFDMSHTRNTRRQRLMQPRCVVCSDGSWELRHDEVWRHCIESL